MTLLLNLLQGREASPLVLVEDDASHNGRALRDAFVRAHAAQGGLAVVVCTTSTAAAYSAGLEQPPLRAAVRLVDALGDTYGWETEAHGGGQHPLAVADPGFFASLVQRVGDVAGEKPALVVIEDLTPLVTFQSLQRVCAGLKALSQQAKSVVRIVSLVHRDLHGERVLASIAHMATSVLTLNDLSSADGSMPSCAVTHRRRTGKILTSLEAYSLLESEPFVSTKPVSRSPGGSAAPPEDAQDGSDPAADLTFNLNLSDKEKSARAGVERRRTGQIIYQAETADNFDEEEPDDDLLI